MNSTNLFRQATESTSRAFQRELEQGLHGSALEKYKSYLSSISQRYNAAKKINDNDVSKRFMYEVSSISVLVAIIDQWFNIRGRSSLASMTIIDLKEYFPVFVVPNDAQKLCLTITEQISKSDDLATLLQDASSKVFDFGSRYVLSEYHTPSSIAEQLVAYALPSNSGDINKLKIVDPACGHGSLLTLVVKRYLEHGKQVGKSSSEILERVWKIGKMA